MRYFLIVTLLFIVSNTLVIAEVPLINIQDINTHQKSLHVGLYTDTSRSLQVETIDSLQNYADIIDTRFILPTIDANYWFIIKLRNADSSTARQIIGIDQACFEITDLYQHINTSWVRSQNGLLVPIKERSVYSRWPSFEVIFKPGETKTLFIKMHSKYLMPVGIICKSHALHEMESQRMTFYYIFYFGAAIAILLYNLFLFFQLGDKTYLFYVFYVFLLLIWISLDSGLFLYLNSNINLYYFLSVGAPLMGAFLTLFTRELLQVKQYSNWIDKTLISSAIIYSLVAILIGFNVYFYQYLGLIAMPLTIFLLYVGIYGIIKKIPLSRFYVLASSLYIIGLFLIAGLTLDVVPYNSITRYGYVIGSFIELFVLSLALGYRIKLLQADKLKFQNKIIETERVMKNNLELKVKERTEELLESNQSKDKLFSIIAHDLKSPLGSIIGLLEALKENYVNYSEEKRVDFISSIYESMINIFSMVENLLLWSRSHSNRIDFSPIPIDIHSLINEMVRLQETQAKIKNITLVKVSETPIYTLADLEMLKTIIRNLLSNAIKFTHDNGKVTIATIKSSTSKNELLISVTDTGVGIRKEVLPNIFTPEKITNTTGTNNEQGTGFGLLLCKEFVEKHKGKIWAESEVGKGSTFYFTIPIEK